MRTAALVLALLLVLGSLPIVAAGDDDGTDDAREEDGDREGDEADEDGDSDEPRTTGAFVREGSRIQGQHVAFTLEPGRVHGYTVSGQVLFTTIAFDPAAAWEEVEIEDASVEADGDEAEFRAIDSPAGRFRAESDDGIVRITPADGVRVAPAGDGAVRVEADGVHGTLHAEDISIVDGDVLAEDIRFVLQAAGARVFGPDVEAAMLDGRIVVEIHVGPDQEPATRLLGGINATAHRADGRLVVAVQGHGPGRTLLIDLTPGSLAGLDDLRVRFDGQAIAQADDLQDVLDASDGVAEYLLLAGADGVEVLVQVPHFSIHTIELQGSVRAVLEGLEMPLGVFLATAGAATVVVAVTWTMRSRLR